MPQLTEVMKMLSAADEAKLDSLARAFRTSFEHRFAGLGNREEFADRLIVTIPAKHAETGDIRVWVDGDEITVGIGEYFHCHFETYLNDEADLDRREQDAVDRALDFIQDFVTETMFLRVLFKSGRWAGASVLPVNDPREAQSWLIGARDDNQGDSDDCQEVDYLWSGPKSPRP